MQPQSLLNQDNSFSELVSGLRVNWEPHDGQKVVGKEMFYHGKKSIFVQCGRKWGKTEFALDCLWNIAYRFPNSPCYFIAPYQTQAREIVWADPRIKEFGPREWLKPGSAGINNTELRLNFNNGSFIKIDGSDNYDKYRGPRFKICVYEEYKDHRAEFRRAMRPNASVLDGWELFIGSPPEMECDYTMLAADHRADTQNKFYYWAPTWQNPHISKAWLEKEKADCYARGEGDVWEREYEARFVQGGASKIFPMITKQMIVPHNDLMNRLVRDWKKLEWIWFADPAAATCFATLFLAHNPYTKDIYCLNEIYETNQADMTVKVIGSRIFKNRDELCSRAEWRQGYDEAETWFMNEIKDNFDEHLEPSQKARNDKENGMSLIKDIMLAGKFHISDRCKNLFWEMDNYFKDKQGRVPKKNDHLIDCLRYALGCIYYSLPETAEYREENDPEFRGRSISQDFSELSKTWGSGEDF